MACLFVAAVLQGNQQQGVGRYHFTIDTSIDAGTCSSSTEMFLPHSQISIQTYEPNVQNRD